MVLESLLAPIETSEAAFNYLRDRTKLTVMGVLGQIRKRIGFFGIYNLFDTVELEQKKLTKIREQHERNIAKN